jgi:hypothetical protein
VAANVDLLELITKPDRLSFQNQLRFSCLMILELRNREHEYFQYKAGVLDQEAWSSYRQILTVTFSNERGRRWWKSFGSGIFAPEFSRMVDEVILELPEEDLRAKLGSWE